VSKLINISKTVAVESSHWVAANPTSTRLALAVLTAVVAAVSVLLGANPVAACDGLTAGGGGC